MVLSRTSLVPWYLQGKAILIASINLFFLLLSMLYPLKTETWTFMQHRKSLDFVHTIKETTHLEQLPFTILVARAFSSSLPEKPEGWSTANSLQMLLKVFFTFTIIFVFFALFALSCCCPYLAFLFIFKQALQVSATSFSPRRTLVLFLPLRPKRQCFGKRQDERRCLLFLFLLHLLLSKFLPLSVPHGRQFQRRILRRVPWVSSQFLRGRQDDLFLVCFTLVDLQSIFRFIRFSTFFTLESFVFKWEFGFPFQELLFPSLVPPQSWGACSLLPCNCSFSSSFPGVQGKGEGRGNGEGDAERLSHVGQCLAKIQALGHQGRVITSHCSWHHVHRPRSHGWSLGRVQNNWKTTSHFIWIKVDNSCGTFNSFRSSFQFWHSYKYLDPFSIFWLLSSTNNK